MSTTAHLDLAMKQRIHVVGVGGPGMSAIAQVLIEMGHRVSGSDIKESETIERLRGIGVGINIGHDAGVVHHCDAVTASTAIPAKNVELTEALNIGVPVLTRAQMLAAICRQKLSVGVAGTHGKTTTSSMLMAVMREAQLHPSFIIGGDVRGIGSGASWGSGKYLGQQSSPTLTLTILITSQRLTTWLKVLADFSMVLTDQKSCVPMMNRSYSLHRRVA